MSLDLAVMDHSYWERSRRVTKSKARLGARYWPGAIILKSRVTAGGEVEIEAEFAVLHIPVSLSISVTRRDL